ncbi:deoxyhypusine hydroxylase isoform X2 [Diceros bicornis minor]|uniref:deoxyhypusine hydroxylase isoform X2 n=1 Tax=Diceros bicornis minor TaxID=77932 RepID=UPI0026E92276|nr:deoxyhypusine hydroxylase isoform X2 [Diceros bicornis minor]
MVTEQEVEAIGQALVDPAQPLHARFRALFTLRGLGGPSAIAWISRAFDDDSALLKHELAYCLGQMQDTRAIPVLVGVLRDPRQEPMVRHEAGEALGAIGDPAVLEILQQYASDPVVEVAETCQLAVRRLEWLQQRGGEPAPVGPYLSVDPAPPAEERDVGRLREVLLDEARPLFDRYRAMFALRNAGGEEAALALAEGNGNAILPGASLKTLGFDQFKVYSRPAHFSPLCLHLVQPIIAPLDQVSSLRPGPLAPALTPKVCPPRSPTRGRL